MTASSIIFDLASVGDSIEGIFSTSSWHLMTGAALYDDTTANHVDLEHSAKGRFGAPVMHGCTVVGMMMSLATRRYNYALEGLLESTARFTAPVYVDENVYVRWVVVGKAPKASFGGGILELRGVAWAGKDRRMAAEVAIRIGLSNYSGPPFGAVLEPPRGTQP